MVDKSNLKLNIAFQVLKLADIQIIKSEPPDLATRQDRKVTFIFSMSR